jgi:hypothetical protein
MLGASLAHVKAMHRTMKYCTGTSERGLLLKPTCKWDGNPAHEFVITGRSDSDYAKDTDNQRLAQECERNVCLYLSARFTNQYEKQHAEEHNTFGN